MNRSLHLSLCILMMLNLCSIDVISQPLPKRVNVFLDYELFPARGMDVLLFSPSLNSYDSVHVSDLGGSVSATFNVVNGPVDLHVSIEDCDGSILMKKLTIDSNSVANQNIIFSYCKLRTACWDVDGDALCDANEDLDNSSICDSADCVLQCHPQFNIVQAGAMVTFENLKSSNSISWSFSDGSQSTMNSPVMSFSPGRYTACLEFSGPLSSCNVKYDKACKGFTVLTSNTCEADFSYGTSFQGNLIYFNNNSRGGDGSTKYLWDFGDGSSSIMQNPIKVYQSKTNNTVCLIQQSGNCGDTICKAVSVLNLGWRCDTGQISTFGFIDEERYKVEIRDTSDKFWLDYQWDFGNGQTKVGSNGAIVSFASPGNYNSCLKTYSPIEHCSDSTCINILPPDTLDYCKADFRVQNTGGLSFQFNNASINIDPNFKYVWSFGDGTTDTKENPLHGFPAWSAGRTVDVCLRLNGIGLSLHDCTDSECKKLLVTSVDELENDIGLRLFPNPSSGRIFVEYQTDFAQFNQVEIVNALGDKVFEQAIESNGILELNLKALDNGWYLINIKGTDRSLKRNFLLNK